MDDLVRVYSAYHYDSDSGDGVEILPGCIFPSADISSSYQRLTHCYDDFPLSLIVSKLPSSSDDFQVFNFIHDSFIVCSTFFCHFSSSLKLIHCLVSLIHKHSILKFTFSLENSPSFADVNFLSLDDDFDSPSDLVFSPLSLSLAV